MKLGISSCLLGNMCRYDGGHSRDKYIVNILQEYFDLVTYCPEEKVFGTPREVIRLVDVDESVRVFTSKTDVEVTDKLQEISDIYIKKIKEDKLCGFILKSQSPSCGMERVKVYRDKVSQAEKKGTGIFARNIMEAFPYLPVEEEGRLGDAWLRENFLMQVFAYADMQEFLEGEVRLKKLVEFHTKYKYLINTKSEVSYKKLGNIVANHEGYHLDEVLEKYKEEFFKAIALKGCKKKTYNVLMKIYSYFKQDMSIPEREMLVSSFVEFKKGIIPLIAVMKIVNVYTKRFENSYLEKQKFLNPYPSELALRSNVNAYK